MHHILVVGGGISGLCSVIALSKLNDVKISLFERSNHASERVGVEISLLYSLGMCLEGMGCNGACSAIAEFGNRLTEYCFLDSHGQQTETIDITTNDSERAGFAQETQAKRVDLINYLWQLAEKALASRPGSAAYWGHTLTAVEQDANGVVAKFANGVVVHGDLLVGADGTRSTVRPLCVDRTSPTFSGVNIIYGTIEGEALLSAKDPSRFFVVAEDKFSLVSSCCGRPNDRYTWYGILYPSSNTAVLTDSTLWDADEARTRKIAQEVLADTGLVLKDYLQSTTTPLCYSGPLWKRDISTMPDTWHNGRVVLVGDSIHAMLPWAGAGGSMAAEDAFVLWKELARHGWERLDHALCEYARVRRPRVIQVMLEAESSAPGGLADSSALRSITANGAMCSFAQCPVFQYDTYTADASASFDTSQTHNDTS